MTLEGNQPKIYNPDTRMLLPYNIAFFANKEGQGGEKTEKPTTKRRKKARDEGQVARSQELNSAALILAVFTALLLFGSWIYRSMETIIRYNLMGAGPLEDVQSMNFMGRYITYMFSRALMVSAPILVTAMATGLIVSFLQVKWNPTTKPLKPKFSKMNPIKGVKRLFSAQHLMELPKNLAKMAIIGLVIYWVLMRELPFVLRYIEMDIITSLEHICRTSVDLAFRVGLLFLVVAAIDYPYQRYKHEQELKMTKYEIKEEHKQTEGDPKVKSKIRQKMMQASMRRMMQEVPSADVIITNPTHYAVAVKYDRLKSSAPIVVAKGVDYMAKKIKERAIDSNVEIVENKPLARALYNTVDIGREIPADLYQAVAEVLAFVYKLRNKA